MAVNLFKGGIKMQLLLIFSLLANFLLLIWNFKLIDKNNKIKTKWYQRYSQLKNQCLSNGDKETTIKFDEPN